MQELIFGFAHPLGSRSRIPALGITWAQGTTVPTNGIGGYAPSCFYQNTSGTNGTCFWINIGTYTSSQWVNIDSPDGGFVTATAAFTASPLVHGGRTTYLSLLAGFAVTIPAATGSGLVYRFVIGIINTSGSYAISVPAGTMYGNVVNGLASGGAANTYITSAGTTLTLDAAHKGGAAIGDYFQLQDGGAGLWYVSGVVTGTTALATPFS